MEDVLEVYTRPRDPQVVCLDGTSKQLIAETHVPEPAAPGRPARLELQIRSQRTANLFMIYAPLEGWRHVKVTDRRAAIDCKRCFDPIFKFPCARAIIRGVIWRSACAYARA